MAGLPSARAGAIVSGLAGLDPPAPFLALPLIALLRGAVGLADARVRAVAGIDFRLRAPVQFDRPQAIGAMLCIFLLCGQRRGERGQDQRGERKEQADHDRCLPRNGFPPAERRRRPCFAGCGPICARPMTTPRKTLSLSRVVAPASGPELSPEAQLIAQAIRRKLCITAVYNKTAMVITPHILYTKHDDPFIDGVVTLRDGKVPAEPKLGTFKLAGLNSVMLTADNFEPHALFDPTDAKYEGVTLAKLG